MPLCTNTIDINSGVGVALCSHVEKEGSPQAQETAKRRARVPYRQRGRYHAYTGCSSDLSSVKSMYGFSNDIYQILCAYIYIGPVAGWLPALSLELHIYILLLCGKRPAEISQMAGCGKKKLKLTCSSAPLWLSGR